MSILRGLLALVGVLGMVMSSMDASAADQFDAFGKQVFQSSAGEALPYRILAPEEVKEGEKYPLVLFLHGAGERGADNEKQLVHVVPELARPEMRKRYPAFVIAPQCPEGSKWVDISWSEPRHTMPEKPSAPMASVMELVDSLVEELPIDPDRIYLVGLSMGGFGTWDLLQRQPGKYAGAIPICGGGDPAFADAMTKTPIWVFHGDQDGAVNVQRSREMVQALRQAGGHPIYTEYPGVGHNSWTATAENRLVWDWLFAQSR